MENSKKPKVSIIILSWNTQKLLEQCLKSIPFSVEIIVVDNGSTDDSLGFLENLKWPNLKVIKNEKNLGFAKANNQGIKAANGDLIMLLNSDTIVQKGAIENLISFYEKQKDKNIAFSPLLLNFDKTIQENYYMKFPNLWQIFFYHNPLGRVLGLKTPLKRLILENVGKVTMEIDQLPGAALIAPKEVWDKVGLLDEDFQFLYEDVDWSWRLKKAGIKRFLVPEAKIIHLGGGSWKQRINLHSFGFYCQMFSSLLFFVKKNYGQKRLSQFRRALILNFLLRFKFKLAKYFLDQGNQVNQKELWG
jgi:GT2 family glycosyltransferase